jgi:hypothetical protein
MKLRDNVWPSKSVQATRDGVSSSAIADYVISPACLIYVSPTMPPNTYKARLCQ